jgi:hypothetical protein
VPGYEIIRELGRGGMGVVYLARQTKLNRPVALKMILAGSHAGAADLARFQTEAEAIARLRHPNIVQVYEVGEHEGKPYFSLEFCGGGSLEKKLGGTPLPAREAAALVETLARAMQAAHEQHVIHRDLKPANVLLAEDGTPKITDFGLAKKLDEAGQTQSGAIMGAPSYMAPEQAGYKPDAQAREIGPAADVYALGAILYECLTGRPPFKAATALDTILQVVSDEPVPPSQLQPKTPRDLETICLKCLHKDRAKRYGSARELADDLRRFLGGEPIRARPVGRLERAAKWVKRNPVVAALLAAVVLSVMGGASGIFLKYQDAINALIARDAALGQARDDAEAARTANREAQYQLAISNVLLAQAAWNDNHVEEALERLELVPPESRRWELYYLNRLYRGGIFRVDGPTGSIPSVAFSPDGTRLATGGDTARVWDARTGRLLLECKGPTPFVLSVVCGPDATRLATVGEDKRARLWDARTGQPILECKGATGVRSMSFSPDGTRLATSGEDRTVRVWDARTGHELLKCEGHTDIVTGVTISPDGAPLATTDAHGTARLWDARPLPLPPDEELEYRLWATRPEPGWHREQFRNHEHSDRFAAAFHLDRYLAYHPEERDILLGVRTQYLEETLRQNKGDASARLLLARSAWHAPALAPNDTAALLPSADATGLLQRRTRAGLLLRQQKAAEAVAVLEAALKERSDDKPPVEELLMAWAYLDTMQPDKAKEQWAKATTWLDRGQEAARAANVVGALPGGVLPGVATLLEPPADPRYNPFDWETWHEIDVLRRELAPRFEGKKP